MAPSHGSGIGSAGDPLAVSPSARPGSVGTLTNLLLLLAIGAGIVARCIAVPLYRAESGDEWGNTIAPFRILFEHGDPCPFGKRAQLNFSMRRSVATEGGDGSEG